MTTENTSSHSRLNIFSQSTCLISVLAEQLIKFTDEERTRLAVVLPTQRLIVNLLAKLGQSLGSYRPPQLFTLEDFLKRAADPWMDTNLEMSSMVQELSLASLIEQKSYLHVTIGHEHEVRQFFQDITEAGLGEQAFHKLKAVLSQDQYRAEEHLQSLFQRISEVEDLYHSFLHICSSDGQTPTFVRMMDRAKLLKGRWQNCDAFPWNGVYFACFTTVKDYLLDFIRFLLTDTPSTWLLSESPQLYGRLSPLNTIKDALVDIPCQSETSQKVFPSQRRRIHQASDLYGEVKHVCDLVKLYIEAGTPESHIAVLLTNETLYGPLVKSLFFEGDIPCNLAIAQSLSQTSPGTWISDTIHFMKDPNDLKTLLTAICHPISLVWLKDFFDPTDSPLNVKQRLIHSICQTRTFSSVEDFLESCQDEPVKVAISRFLHQLNPLSLQQKEQSLSSWIHRFEEICTAFSLFSSNSNQDQGLNTSIKIAIQQLLEDLKQGTRLSNPKLSLFDFLKLISNGIKQTQVRTVGYPLEGVQVLSLTEARFVPFQVVIILGCLEGQFPKAMPHDDLIDDWFKTQIGLPGWQYIESLEDTTFHLLKARVPILELTYPEEMHGELTVRSRYLERLITFQEAAFHRVQPSIERPNTNIIGKESIKHGEFTGDRSPISQRFSASSLTMLLNCPYQFLLHKLGLQALKLPEEDLAMAEGEWLHKVMESLWEDESLKDFYRNKKSNAKSSPPAISLILQRLCELSHQFAPKNDSVLPLLQHLESFAWPRLANHIFTLLQTAGSRPPLKEWAFGKDLPLSITLGEHHLTMTGTIDSLDSFADCILVTDYKRNSLPDLSDVAQGDKPQLIFYAMALQASDPEFNPENILVGYWSLLSAKPLWVCGGKKAKHLAMENGLISKPIKYHLKDLIIELKAKWQQRMDDHWRDGINFRVQANEKKWCRTCQQKNICRLNDPAHVPTFDQREVSR